MRTFVVGLILVLSSCNLFDETPEPFDADTNTVVDSGADTTPYEDLGGSDTSLDAATEDDLGVPAEMGAVDVGGPDVGVDTGTDLNTMPAPLPVGIVGYSFDEVLNGTFDDVSGPPTYDLQIVGTVSKTPGGVFISADAALETSEPPVEWIDAVMASQEFAVAMWVATSAVEQGGPGEAQNVRIVTNSLDSAARNIHIAQFGDDVLLRLRTSGSDSNGTPNVILPNVFADTAKHFHVFQATGGFIEYYFDGQLVLRQTTSGQLVGWDPTYLLRLGNEFGIETRPWAGTFYDLQLYDRAFTAGEISNAFMAGEPVR